jgi:DNA polymerase III alpha subunit (gram-positive type)
LARLEGPLPNQDICPECHYLEGRSVALEHLSAAGKDSPAMSCPACGLEVVPG